MNTICPQVLTTSVQIMPSPSHSPKSCWVSGSPSIKNQTAWMKEFNYKVGVCIKSTCAMGIWGRRPSGWPVSRLVFRQLLASLPGEDDAVLGSGSLIGTDSVVCLRITVCFLGLFQLSSEKPPWNGLVVWGWCRQLFLLSSPHTVHSPLLPSVVSSTPME